jgi:hypothetical protein
MNHTKRKRQAIGYSALFVFYLILGLLILQIPTYFSAGKTVIPIAIAYPSITEGTLQDNWLQITFNLEANSSLAENVNLTITNVVATTFPNSTGMDISDVWVGFQYAQPWSSFVSANTASGQIQNHFLTALDGDWLVLNTSATMQSIGSLSVLYQMAFHFPASGEYSPSIIIGLYNGTFLAQTYNQIQIQIPSSTVKDPRT